MFFVNKEFANIITFQLNCHPISTLPTALGESPERKHQKKFNPHGALSRIKMVGISVYFLGMSTINKLHVFWFLHR